MGIMVRYDTVQYSTVLRDYQKFLVALYWDLLHLIMLGTQSSGLDYIDYGVLLRIE